MHSDGIGIVHANLKERPDMWSMDNVHLRRHLELIDVANIEILPIYPASLPFFATSLDYCCPHQRIIKGASSNFCLQVNRKMSKHLDPNSEVTTRTSPMTERQQRLESHHHKTPTHSQHHKVLNATQQPHYSSGLASRELPKLC